jgi:hypothetical protein
MAAGSPVAIAPSISMIVSSFWRITLSFRFSTTK